MTKRKVINRIRKWHRYLGLVLGIQFLLWTLGGFYFSWTNIKEIRGDHLKKEQSVIPKNLRYVPPSSIINTLLEPSELLLSMKLTTILEAPIYEMEYLSDGEKKVVLINALDGKIRKPLYKVEAIQIARQKLKVQGAITEVVYFTETGGHHEYRGRPLPAYAITFDAPTHTTVYVSQNYGTVQTLRSNQWRVFDFLWMLHTMDYQGRDNFNNLLLRAFSLFGLFTIFSGFALFFLTSKTFNHKKTKS
ncbi:MAG: PepSY domain-containing protein [Saonia sp.]